MKLKSVPYGRDIRHLTRILVRIAETKTAQFPQIYTQLEDVLFKSNTSKTTLARTLGKGEYFLVIGKMPRGFIHEANRIALQYGVKNLRFENDLDKLKNGSVKESCSSSRCIGIICGAIPHSISGGYDSFADKTVLALVPNTGTRKLTTKTFRVALMTLLARFVQ